MARQDNNRAPNPEEADLAKAFQELARGEQTAAALEANLTALEAKIEELLVQADMARTADPSELPNGDSTSESVPDQETK